MAGPPQRTSFVESNTERSRRLAELRERKQRSKFTVEAKRARREQEKVQKKKARCGESLQASLAPRSLPKWVWAQHYSQARYKLYAHFSCSIQP